MNNYGLCCNCALRQATVLMMVGLKSPEPGIGCWGCLRCGLPQAGAVVVLCDRCLEENPFPQRVCLGSPADNRRVTFSALSPEPFEHDMSKHVGEPSPQELEAIKKLAEEFADRMRDQLKKASARDRHFRN